MRCLVALCGEAIPSFPDRLIPAASPVPYRCCPRVWAAQAKVPGRVRCAAKEWAGLRGPQGAGRETPETAGLPGCLRRPLSRAGRPVPGAAPRAGAGRCAVEGLEVLGDVLRLQLPGLGVHREQQGQVGPGDVQALKVQRSRCREVADRGPGGLGVAGQPLDDPLQHADVLAEAGPDELARRVLAEPVDVEQLRQLLRVGLLADLQPVPEVVAHVVAAERQHREGVVAQLADLALGRGGLLRGDVGAEEHAVVPVEGLDHQRHGAGAPAAEQDRRDRHARRGRPTRAR